MSNKWKLLLAATTSLMILEIGLPAATAAAAKTQPIPIYDSYFQMNGQNYYNYYLTNTGQVIQSSADGAFQAWAQAFTTPAGSPEEVTSYMAALTGRGTSVSPTAVFQLVTDVGGLPNMSQVIDQIKLRKVTTDFDGRNYSFKSAKRPSLTPSTQYWLVLSTPTVGASLECLSPSESVGSLNAFEASNVWQSSTDSIPCSEEIMGLLK
jgi:hypothetical protein